jgi:uncharacterized OsmC-like protein
MSETTETAAVTLSGSPIAPIDKDGLNGLIEKGKADPSKKVTLKNHTVLEGKFRHLNYVRDLPAHVIDEPPHLLGDDTAPNPSEASLAALGSCISVGIHANAIARGIQLTKLELHLEGDVNVTSVWGAGDQSDKPLGFTDVRVKVDIDGDVSREELDDLVHHADYWSPVANTFRNPVNTEVSLLD